MAKKKQSAYESTLIDARQKQKVRPRVRKQDEFSERMRNLWSFKDDFP